VKEVCKGKKQLHTNFIPNWWESTYW